MAALLQGLICCFSQPVDGSETKICDGCLGFLESKLFNLEILVVEAVADKVNKIRNNRFCPSASRRSASGCWQQAELDKDLTYDTNARLFLIGDRIVSKSWTISRHIFEGTMADAAACYEGNDALLPDLCLRFTIPFSSS